ncbi:MAG: FIST C-terminal domain-containing protein [Planctomycetes bacterium]|nr:FIST C-terminal domain-containing protein [Planctomycetota bacterium]
MSSPSENLRFASALSVLADPERAVAEACEQAATELGVTPDLAVLFLSADAVGSAAKIAQIACDRLGTECLIGCTGESLVGRGREVEGQTAASLWLARLPGVALQPIKLTFQNTAEGPSILGWPDSLLDGWPAEPCLLLLGEPFSFPADFLLEQTNRLHPDAMVIGGMASGASAPGENRLLLGRRVYDDGAVAVMISGSLRIRSVVSQGCRPIGRHFVITKAEQNVIHQLGGKSAFGQLEAVFAELPTHEQELVNHGLHLGRVVSEYQDRFEQGDFLIRNVIGFDPENGAIAVGDYLRVGQTVQFHVRDWHTADAELRQLLAAVRRQVPSSPAGALMFTCNGRGTRLFPEPHHDALAVRDAFGEIPLAGFFAAGELGPIGGQNFQHGFTASIALFEPSSGE